MFWTQYDKQRKEIGATLCAKPHVMMIQLLGQKPRRLDYIKEPFMEIRYHQMASVLCYVEDIFVLYFYIVCVS